MQPDLIVETGIAHGGSLIFSASMLELNAACGGPADARVVGVDIDIRAHNRAAIEAHPMFKRITMLARLEHRARDRRGGARPARRQEAACWSCLDSNHTHDHVLAELEAYAPMTSVGSYCVVFDTIVEDLPADMFPRPAVGPGRQPEDRGAGVPERASRVRDRPRVDHKLLISVAPAGYLKRVR